MLFIPTPCAVIITLKSDYAHGGVRIAPEIAHSDCVRFINVAAPLMGGANATGVSDFAELAGHHHIKLPACLLACLLL